ncbi:MAG: ABC transporter ATP-binding protein [Candidatus Delongbacteria bacterium]|nr:ABC transporter ATP-binding protein [Candidatus Delongbacteria bacterium]MBN2835526.1 ABC transporter ATP-binding protein [Candidatus Delongbacteria bacterium]
MSDIFIENLVKKYRNGKSIVTALDNINLSVEEGELFGLIGPDGAGKTSLFRILTTLLTPDSGIAKVNGLDVVNNYRQIRNLIGYMPGRFSLYQDLTVEENLKFFATIFNTTIEENYDLVKPIYSQIEPFKNRKAGKLSGGMKQKLALSCALIHKPKVLLLDEPTTGVDPVSRQEFWEMLKSLKEAGITILVSTPYMDEASLCSRVALIQDGKILSIDTPNNIIQSFKNPLYAIKSKNMHKLNNDLKSYPNCNTVYIFGEYLHYTNKGVFSSDVISKYLVEKGHTGLEILPIEPTIEDCFMELSENV